MTVCLWKNETRMSTKASIWLARNERVSSFRNGRSATISPPRLSLVMRKKTKKIMDTRAAANTAKHFSALVPARNAVEPYFV